MRLRGLIPFGLVLSLCIAAPSGGTPPVEAERHGHGYLIHPAESGKTAVLPYQPRAGDIVLYDDFNKFHHFLYKLAKTAAPIHAAMVIERPDGTPALLELTGPYVITAKVCILDVEQRFRTYNGAIMVRPLREPLGPQQTQELYDFAQAQVGKSFAVGRIMLQGGPLCARSGLRRELFGKTHMNRQRWYCSELVVAACTRAGLFNPRVIPANATYPRDLAFDETVDLSPLYHSVRPWVGDRSWVGQSK